MGAGKSKWFDDVRDVMREDALSSRASYSTHSGFVEVASGNSGGAIVNGINIDFSAAHFAQLHRNLHDRMIEKYRRWREEEGGRGEASTVFVNDLISF